MSADVEPTTTMTVRVPQSMRKDFEALAKATGRNRNTLAQEALRRFLDVERWQIAVIEQRIEEADVGAFATDEDVQRVYAKFNIAASNSGERVAG